MTWYPDMGTETMIDTGDHIRAVGWLSSKHPFPTGRVGTEFLDRLRAFAAQWVNCTEALGWGMFMGIHCCELCNQFHSAGNFGVPGGSILFVAPDMIPHYVEVHYYRPPDEFIAAVIRSPLPNSEEYRVEIEPFRLLNVKHRDQQHEQQI